VTGRLTVFATVVLIASLSSCGGSDHPHYSNPSNVINTVIGENETHTRYETLVNASLQSTNGYWEQAVPQLYSQPYLAPDVRGAYVPSRDTVDCGGRNLAQKGNAFYCPSDNFIAWDEPTFLYFLYKNLAALAPTFILAHEWGHAIQKQLGVDYRTTIDSEQGADCLAGAWAQNAAARGELSRDDFDAAVETLFTGRDRPGTAWFARGAHGTGFERNKAFIDGYERGPTGCIKPVQPVSFKGSR
jgi:uncharacterized protein